jgi:2-oxoglutarate ferredoxin oxidoreductase subunit beta
MLHLMRRNLNVTVLLFNNRIYGLTKGQYSPTSPLGTRTKTTPTGSIDNPLNPLLFALGAEATFIARTVDNNPKHMVETFKAAHQHQGISFVEILQNCVIFNDSAWDPIYGKENRDQRMLFLEAGQPLLFGKNKQLGIRLNGLSPEIVDAATAAPGEILTHHPDHPSPLYSHMLATLGLPDFPTPMGVVRQILRPTYETLIHNQVENSKAKRGCGTWRELLHGNSTWTVE